MDVWAPPNELHSIWMKDLWSALTDQGIEIEDNPTESLLPATVWKMKSEDWGMLARSAQHQDCRWVGLWLDDLGDKLRATAALSKNGRFLLVRTDLPSQAPSLPSHAPYFPGADRPERHAADLFGVTFIGHLDSRRWIRHQAWQAQDYPLRKAFPASGNPAANTPPDRDYPFLHTQTPEVYEIPVGPVHAGIIEPGHFRFLAVGEAVLNLEERLGYVHKGIEKIAEGRDAQGLARLAGRVSGDTTVAHAWAACMAMERAYAHMVPPRGLRLRAVLAERERIANHLGDIGAICNDVGFPFAHYQFSRLRELWLRDNAAWFGHRLLMDQVVPGGVATDLNGEATDEMGLRVGELGRELDELRPILDANHSLQDRLVGAGILTYETAKALGCLGYVGRASGFDCDLRRERPYGPYDELEIEAVSRTEGDVAARLNVRYDELYASLGLLEQLLARLHPGAIQSPWPTEPHAAEGLGVVEGWRGEILCYVRFDREGRVARFFTRDPSVFNWPALEQLIHGNIVPDFPLCNKSVNGSYAGHDL